jgi:hypothetical protein
MDCPVCGKSICSCQLEDRTYLARAVGRELRQMGCGAPPLATQNSGSFVFHSGDVRDNTIETPPGICQFLHDLISKKYQVNTILDPCCGGGNLTRPWNCKIISYEILQKKDFFKEQKKISCDLVLCNPPFNGATRFFPYLFLQKIYSLVNKKTPLALFTPMAFRLDQSKKSNRWRELRDDFPEITGIVSLPHDAFGKNVKVHSEILFFNLNKLKPHYFLPEKYL